MPHTFIIFGASGDLTRRKLIPALYRTFLKGRLPEETKIVGVSRSELDDDAYRARLEESTQEFAKADFDVEKWGAFASGIHYLPGDITNGGDFGKLGNFLDKLDSNRGTRIFYLATMPSLYQRALDNLGGAGLAAETPETPRRVVIEKPFGVDLASARSLNEAVHRSRWAACSLPGSGRGLSRESRSAPSRRRRP